MSTRENIRLIARAPLRSVNFDNSWGIKFVLNFHIFIFLTCG